MRKGPDFYFDGPIDSDLYFELTTITREPIKRIHLNSEGGITEDAILIAQYIRENNIETFVRKEAKCMSACTLLFQAGVRRTAHPSARFMYHSVRFAKQKPGITESVKHCLSFPDEFCTAFIQRQTERLQKITDQIFKLYIEYGAKEALYLDYMTTKEEPHWVEDGNYLKLGNWYMTAEEVQFYGVVTHLSNRTCQKNQYCF